MNKIVIFSFFVYVLDMLIYYCGLDFIDPSFHGLLPFDGEGHSLYLSEWYFYAIDFIICSSLVIYIFNMRLGFYLLILSFFMIIISLAVSGIRIVAPIMDLLNVTKTIAWGALVFISMNEYKLGTLKYKFLSNNITKHQLVMALCFIVIMLFNSQLFLAYSFVFKGDEYFSLLQYDAPSINDTAFLIGIVLLNISLLGVMLKNKWSRFVFYTMTIFYILYSAFCGVRIYVPEVSIMRFVMELMWGGLLLLMRSPPRLLSK
ncbi:hypothetical protein L4C38_17970 [Vibrio kasasachensis]|uniref:hypothetical protein n=1 Tax=Vibrio kasasachensis TaxID=2910248 RepID=UPI003D0A6669